MVRVTNSTALLKAMINVRSTVQSTILFYPRNRSENLSPPSLGVLNRDDERELSAPLFSTVVLEKGR